MFILDVFVYTVAYTYYHFRFFIVNKMLKHKKFFFSTKLSSYILKNKDL